MREALKALATMWTGASRLRRFALLRDFTHAIHARRSELIAGGDAEGAELIARCERLIEREVPIEAPSLDAIVERARGGVAGEKHLEAPVPERVRRLIGPAKLDRADRAWERRIASEAGREGWRFWTLEAAVQVSEVEAWAAELNRALWPRAVVLFTESAGFRDGYWRGRWTLAAEPGFEGLDAEFATWPGNDGSTPPELKELLLAAG